MLILKYIENIKLKLLKMYEDYIKICQKILCYMKKKAILA